MLKKITYPYSPHNQKLNIDGLNEHYNPLCILDSNARVNKNRNFYSDKIIAVGATAELLVNSNNNALEQLQEFCDKGKNGWLFGYLSYDLKNEIEQLDSGNIDNTEFPCLHFFIPEVILQIENNRLTVFYDDSCVTKEKAETIYHLAFDQSSPSNEVEAASSFISLYKPTILSRITKQEYINSVNQLKQHIAKGDIYEVNFCQEFFAENAIINTVDTFKKLNTLSQAPFSAFYKTNNHYLLCASPERFIRKQANKIISQPIKGTAKRSVVPLEDEKFKLKLRNSEKEKSENVMIVDLVRNDLSKLAERGTVNVDELFGIYSFKQVHQMISTISCELKNRTTFTDIIKSTFPMGSMTGAPKVNAMKLIEKYENTKRGLYSGSVGYINPDGDFDFNVVIRSILYNAENKYLSFMVGSAITNKSDAESEYEECLLKAKAMFEVLK